MSTMISAFLSSWSLSRFFCIGCGAPGWTVCTYHLEEKPACCLLRDLLVTEVGNFGPRNLALRAAYSEAAKDPNNPPLKHFVEEVELLLNEWLKHLSYKWIRGYEERLNSDMF